MEEIKDFLDVAMKLNEAKLRAQAKLSVTVRALEVIESMVEDIEGNTQGDESIKDDVLKLIKKSLEGIKELDEFQSTKA